MKSNGAIENPVNSIQHNWQQRQRPIFGNLQSCHMTINLQLSMSIERQWTVERRMCTLNWSLMSMTTPGVVNWGYIIELFTECHPIYKMAIVREGQRPYITHSQQVTYLCKRVLNEPKVWLVTVKSSKLFQSSTTLWPKECFLRCNLACFLNNLRLWPLQTPLSKVKNKLESHLSKPCKILNVSIVSDHLNRFSILTSHNS